MRYRVRTRFFTIALLEQIVRSPSERYFDTDSGREIAIGRHNDKLVVIPYEIENDVIIPVTVHATTRQQINLRLRSGRYIYD